MPTPVSYFCVNLFDILADLDPPESMRKGSDIRPEYEKEVFSNSEDANITAQFWRIENEIENTNLVLPGCGSGGFGF